MRCVVGGHCEMVRRTLNEIWHGISRDIADINSRCVVTCRGTVVHHIASDCRALYGVPTQANRGRSHDSRQHSKKGNQHELHPTDPPQSHLHPPFFSDIAHQTSFSTLSFEVADGGRDPPRHSVPALVLLPDVLAANSGRVFGVVQTVSVF